MLRKILNMVCAVELIWQKRNTNIIPTKRRTLSWNCELCIDNLKLPFTKNNKRILLSLNLCIHHYYSGRRIIFFV